MYSCGPPHMDVQEWDDQHEPTYSSCVRTRDVTLKTCRRRWMIGRNGERRSGISAQAARHDDDDDDIYIRIYLCSEHFNLIYENRIKEIYVKILWSEDNPCYPPMYPTLHPTIYIYIYIYIYRERERFMRRKTPTPKKFNIGVDNKTMIRPERPNSTKMEYALSIITVILSLNNRFWEMRISDESDKRIALETMGCSMVSIAKRINQNVGQRLTSVDLEKPHGSTARIK